MKKYISLYITLIFILLVSQGLFAQTDAWRNIGLEYLTNQEPAKAIPFFRQAVQGNPGNGILRMELAYSYQLAGDYDNALLEYTTALGLSDAPVSAIKFNMANIYSNQEKWNEAQRFYAEAIAVDEAFSAAYLNKSIAELSTQEYADAEEDLLKFLELNPTTEKKEDIEKILALIKEMKGFPSESVDKTRYKEKQEIEEQLNQSKTRLRDSGANQFLGE